MSDQNKKTQYIHPTNYNKFSCFKQGSSTVCTFDAFKTVYFNHRLRGDGKKNEIQVEIPWYARMTPGLYIMWKTKSTGVEWRCGSSTANGLDQSEWQKPIDEGKCQLKDWWYDKP
jgi:hypothetical protein